MTVPLSRLLGQTVIRHKGIWHLGNGICLRGDADHYDFASWSGVGPYSTGGIVSVERLSFSDLDRCGAIWFAPFLQALKRGEPVLISAIDQAHMEEFGKPIFAFSGCDLMDDMFRKCLQIGEHPSGFLPCVKIIDHDHAV